MLARRDPRRLRWMACLTLAAISAMASSAEAVSTSIPVPAGSDRRAPRLWFAAGPSTPDDQGLTGFWKTGFGMEAGVEATLPALGSIYVRAEQITFPARNDVGPSDTIHVHRWRARGITIGTRSHAPVLPRVPAFRAILDVGVGRSQLAFGEVRSAHSWGRDTIEARTVWGSTLTLGAGLELAPPGRAGAFVDGRMTWYLTDQTYTWRSVRAGLWLALGHER